MKVLQLISSEGYYGAESMLVTLAQSISRLGCAATVGVFRDSRNAHTEVGDIARQAGLPVQILPCDGRWDGSTVRNLRGLIEEQSFDILHSHGYKSDLYGYAASWRQSVTRIATCHNWPDPKTSMKLYAAVDRVALRAFHHVSTPSPRVSAILSRSGIKSEKLSFIRNGVDVESFHEAAPTLRAELNHRGRRMVGFVGRLVPNKGGETLLNAAQAVLAAEKDVLFVFVGEGGCRKQWQAKAEELGIADSVIFTGSRTDMPGVYASFDLFVLPSFDEAMPMSLLEAMSAGIPTIATPVGGVPDVVVNGVNGVLSGVGDTAGLTREILSLLRDREKAQRIGANGYQRVMQEFSSEAMAKKYLQIYERAVSVRNAAPAPRIRDFQNE